MNRRQEPPRRIDQPEPGFFRIRLVRHGPFVPARIAHRLGFWTAEINGAPAGEAHVDPAFADAVYRIWTTGTRITEAEYRNMLGQPSVLDPAQPIDIGAQPPVF